jgi:hypothetical protein
LASLEPKGVVYTKRWVVELLLDLAGYASTANVVDAVAVEPAAGEGAFLALMIERLADSCERLGRPISDCRNSLIAYELDDMSAERARTLAAKILTDRGVKLPTAETLAQAWVRTGDYLFDSMCVEADFVIGNPPYVRLEDIPEETASLYRDAYPTMRGRADLYVAFFEAALRQLKDGGVCAFICADRWMRNQYVHAWYKTIDRVTHSLTEKPKLYIADIKDTLEPVLDKGETYPHHNLYYIQSDIWDLEVLGGLLMSAAGQFFVESYGVRMRGGYLRFQAQYLRRIRVPSPDALSKAQTQALREAFNARDKPRATQVALDVYKISPHELERALEY